MNKTSQREVARVQRPERRQKEFREFSLEEFVPADHRVRLIWRYVDSLDFSLLYEQIHSVQGRAGRPAVDPKILFSLWMYATLEGISSARQLERLCGRDLCYMWICGGVGVNHHLLSDFRSTNPEFFDDLLSETVATMMSQGLVSLDKVAQDGMRVRANAGSSSFRREGKLKECLREARDRVAELRSQSDDPALGEQKRSRDQAAQERAAKERESRVEAALKQLEELKARKEKRKKGSGDEARCSTTDPDARKMKVASGGYRPCYNVQFLTTGDSRVIVDYDVSNNGSDGGQMAPLHEQARHRYRKTPKQYLVDGGFTTHNDIGLLDQRGTEVYGPIPQASKILKNGNDPYQRQPKDSDQMYRFRQRMATEQAKELYQQRPSIAEYPNAECRNRGLHQFMVRGIDRVKSSTLLYILAFNFNRWINLTGKKVVI